jgi:transcription elongation factor GreA
MVARVRRNAGRAGGRAATAATVLVPRAADKIRVLESEEIMSIKERLVKRFEDEIQGLDRELRMDLPKEIRRARELGDLSENAEYQAAKERQRLVEARISMLKKRVAEIALLNLDRLPTDKVGLGSIVHVSENGGEAMVYRLVMPEEADATKGLISPSSPIGRAFLNKEPGDEVSVQTPNGGIRRFEILKLVTIHDAL